MLQKSFVRTKEGRRTKSSKKCIGVNFTNILQAAFLYVSLLSSFFELMAQVCIFWRKNIGAIAARTMRVKLTIGKVFVVFCFATIENRRAMTSYLDKKLSSESNYQVKPLPLLFYCRSKIDNKRFKRFCFFSKNHSNKQN